MEGGLVVVGQEGRGNDLGTVSAALEVGKNNVFVKFIVLG